MVRFYTSELKAKHQWSREKEMSPSSITEQQINQPESDYLQQPNE
jgi:hypothetical protein